MSENEQHFRLYSELALDLVWEIEPGDCPARYQRAKVRSIDLVTDIGN